MLDSLQPTSSEDGSSRIRGFRIHAFLIPEAAEKIGGCTPSKRLLAFVNRLAPVRNWARLLYPGVATVIRTSLLLMFGKFGITLSAEPVRPQHAPHQQ